MEALGYDMDVEAPEPAADAAAALALDAPRDAAAEVDDAAWLALLEDALMGDAAEGDAGESDDGEVSDGDDAAGDDDASGAPPPAGDAPPLVPPLVPPPPPILDSQTVVDTMLAARRFGIFKFSRKLPSDRLPYGGLEISCPYHRRSLVVVSFGLEVIGRVQLPPFLCYWNRSYRVGLA